MKFNRSGFMWIQYLAFIALLWKVAAAQAVAPGDYVPLKPNQVPGDTSVPVSVDPARCSKGDKKYIYWAAKGQVFRLPFNPNLPVYAIPDRDLSGQSLRARKETPPPPDPKEPEGCYGNPLRGLSMPYFSLFAMTVYEDLTGRPASSGYYYGGNASAWETEFGPGFWPGISERALQERPHCKTRNSGIQMCLMNSNQDPNSFIPAHVYVIPRSLLPSYFGSKDVRFLAKPSLEPSKKFLVIESHFKLFGNVLMMLTPTVKPEEIDLMVPYHVKLIQYVIDAHVPNYDWRPRR